VDGSVKGTKVNLRKSPALSAPVLGVFRDGMGAVLVLEEARSGDGKYPWYRVLSGALGEGWVYGQYVDVPDVEDVPPTARYGARVRLDFGCTPDLARKAFGPPVREQKSRMRLEEFVVTVSVETLTYADHEVEYWNGSLRRAEVWGGPLGFGPITVGMDAAELDSLLGQPEEKEEGEWRYYDPRGGFDLLALLVNERLFVTRLRYEKSLFE